MFGFNARRARPGMKIPAASINKPADQVARQSRARPGGALAAIVAAGSALYYSTTRKHWLVRITAVGTSTQAGSYSWQAIAPVAGSPGTYTDLTGWTGSLGGDAFFEDNGNSSLAVADRVDVYRDYHSGQVRAQYDHCS
jgi:hypothetical protein